MNTDRTIKIVGKLTMSAKCIHSALVICLFLIIPIGFADDFPNRPALAELNEMVAQGIVSGKAVRERELVVGRRQSFLPYCGVWQPYIVSIQWELEKLAPLYIDHDNGPLTDAGDEFLYFTLDNWRAAAGLNASGFRRSVDGTTMLYGQMQSGDIIGPWVFEDLQNGFNQLKWTKQGGTYVWPAEEHKYVNWYGWCDYPEGINPNLPTVEEMRAQVIAWFNADPWHGTSGNAGYKIIATDYATPGSPYGNWEFRAERIRSRQTLGFPAVNRKVDIYIRTTGDGNFFDFDDTGLVEGVYTLYRSDPETSDTTVVLDYISDISTCPLQGGPGAWVIKSDNWIYYVIKWQFTYGEE